MKECSRCNTVKADEDFNKRSSNADGLQPYCRVCQREGSKAYYQVNKETMRPMIIAANKRRNQASREYVVLYLSTHPCVDCGNTDIRVLEFDHVRGIKRDGVGVLMRSGVKLEVLIEEIEKCEVRCKNCHTIKTYERLGKTWHDDFI